MSNSPNELSFEIDVVCQAQDVEFETALNLALRLKRIEVLIHEQRSLSWSGPLEGELMIRRLRADLVSVLANCPFEGPVEAFAGSWGTFTWTCPVCGTEHEDENEQPEPDEGDR